jgi:hypothetical protein
LTVNSFSLSRGTQNITGKLSQAAYSLFWTQSNGGITPSGAFNFGGSLKPYANVGINAGGYNELNFDASKAWTGSTNSVSPQTNSLGSGQAFDITPSYYTCHMWLRLT